VVLIRNLQSRELEVLIADYEVKGRKFFKVHCYSYLCESIDKDLPNNMTALVSYVASVVSQHPDERVSIYPAIDNLAEFWKAYNLYQGATHD